MRLRTFTAADMPAAMKLVRRELGSHAIILSHDNIKGGGVRITAAIEQEDEPSPTPITAPAPVLRTAIDTSTPALDRLREQLWALFEFHNVPRSLIETLMLKATDKELSSLHAINQISANRNDAQMLKLALEKLLAKSFNFSPLPISNPLEGKKRSFMLVGAPGIGKTQAIAKLATKLTMDKTPVAVITTDVKRAGGVEQLQLFTNILGIDLKIAANAVELARYINPLKAPVNVLIDTAGCNPFNKDDMEELGNFASIKTVEPVLVMAAGSDSMEAADIAENFSMLDVGRLLVTRTDSARRFGSIIAAAAATGLAFTDSSHNASTIAPLEPITPASMVQLLLRYQV